MASSPIRRGYCAPSRSVNKKGHRDAELRFARPRPVDTFPGPMLEPRHRAAILRPEAHRLERRKHFSLLVVRGDGARVARFNIPRYLPFVILAGVTLVTVTLGALVGDWWLMRTRMRQAGGLSREVDGQRATIGAF